MRRTDSREVVNLALSKGPQTITRRKDAVIVISAAEYEELIGKAAELQGVPPHERTNLRRARPETRPGPDAGCRAVRVLLDTCTLAEV